MPAQADRSPHPLAQACARQRMFTALYGCIAMGTVAIGVLGLSGDSCSRQVLESYINVHALFALLLCGLARARYRWFVKRSPRMTPVEIRELSRHLSRLAYLFLYVVIGMRELVGILNSLWLGGPVDLNLIDERFRHGPNYGRVSPKDDFQLFFASGLFALIFVRVLVYTRWSRCRKRAAVAQAALGSDLE
jgi:cytochrome b561